MQNFGENILMTKQAAHSCVIKDLMCIYCRGNIYSRFLALKFSENLGEMFPRYW